jgi:hypothetical protein
VLIASISGSPDRLPIGAEKFSISLFVRRENFQPARYTPSSRLASTTHHFIIGFEVGHDDCFNQAVAHKWR